MQIKAADDKQTAIDSLTAWMARPGIDVAVRRKMEAELRRMQAGARGEREAAYEIEFHFGANPNRMTIHDLRLEADGRVAQIDHLIIDRVLSIWVCESKQFSEGVSVDEFGEWTGFHKRRPYGIPSPIEQNRKHIVVLDDVFSKRIVELPRRLGIAITPEYHSLILVSKEAWITRPKTKAGRANVDGLDSVIKVDQLKTLMDKEGEARGIAYFRRIVGKGEIERVARALVDLHRPASIDWSARFGLRQEATPAPTVTRTPTAPSPAVAACQACGTPVSQAVIDFCRDRATEFGNRVLCMDCQRQARRG